ncbi:MAG: porin [Granulosicoccus sp.]
MKFTKTMVAVAIAGIAATPLVASADTTLAGAVQIQLNGTDGDGDAADPTINADDVLFGITSEHALNGGATGYGSLRVDMNRLSNAGRQTVDPGTPGNDEDDVEIASVGSADSVYVGLKGGFGDFRFGEIPNAVEYGQVANDIYDVSGEINGGISYTGSFGPVGLGLNWSPENNQDLLGVGVKFGIGGFSIGLGAEDRAEAQNAAVGVSFAFSGASVAAHFHTREQAAGDDLESFSVKLGYGVGAISGSLTFSTETKDDADIDNQAIRLDAVYDLGGGFDVSTRITSESGNVAADDLVSWRLKLSKGF